MLIYAAAGGMGNALIDLAKMAGLIVIGVVSSEEKARFARDLGADHTINRKGEKVGERVRDLTRGRGVDIIIDPVAGPTIPDNIQLLAPCGMLILYGALGGRAQHDLQPTLRLTKNSPAVRQFTIHTWDDLIEERRAGMRALIDMLAAGKLHPRIHGHLPLVEAKRAHEMLESGAVIGKLLLRPAVTWIAPIALVVQLNLIKVKEPKVPAAIWLIEEYNGLLRRGLIGSRMRLLLAGLLLLMLLGCGPLGTEPPSPAHPLRRLNRLLGRPDCRRCNRTGRMRGPALTGGPAQRPPQSKACPSVRFRSSSHLAAP